MAVSGLSASLCIGMETYWPGTIALEVRIGAIVVFIWQWIHNRSEGKSIGEARP
jgi:hypothetical protein